MIFRTALIMLAGHMLLQKGLSAQERKNVSLNPGFQLFYLEDKENRLTVSEIQKPENQSEFIRTEKDFFHFNHSQSWHWIKIHPEKNADINDLLLEISEAKLEYVNFYFKDSGGNWQVLSDGYSVPLAKKFKKHYFPVFPLIRHTPESDFYLQIRGNLQPIPVKIVKKSSFEERHLAKNIVYGV
ncbi:MAG TPA: 7TM-DISM domain-containing protein, partial [Leptospiraceae bacterium]|nr:7TM-DISM domain-containing protein [Leptospiraceae bacterium]